MRVASVMLVYECAYIYEGVCCNSILLDVFILVSFFFCFYFWCDVILCVTE